MHRLYHPNCENSFAITLHFRKDRYSRCDISVWGASDLHTRVAETIQFNTQIILKNI